MNKSNRAGQGSGNSVLESLANSKALARQNTRSASGRAFTALLFALFLIALLAAIFAGTAVYKSLYETRESTEDMRSSLSLVTNAIRANDAVGAVEIAEGPEGNALALVERMDSGSYETRIYLYKGQIVQEYALTGVPCTPEKAKPIVESATFEFSYEDGVVSFSTDQGQARVLLRSAEGGVAAYGE